MQCCSVLQIWMQEKCIHTHKSTIRIFSIQHIIIRVEVGGLVFGNKPSNLTNHKGVFFFPNPLRRPTGLSPEIAPLQQQAKQTSVVRGLYWQQYTHTRHHGYHNNSHWLVILRHINYLNGMLRKIQWFRLKQKHSSTLGDLCCHGYKKKFFVIKT